MNFECGL